MRTRDNIGITIGFSVNPEITFGYTDQAGKKGTLDFLSVSLSGSSANVARCLMNMGHNPLLIVPSETGDSDEANLLERALRKAGLLNVRLELMQQTPLAIYPIGDRRGSTSALYGRRGVRADKPELFQKALEQITGFDGKWRLATSINEDFLSLASHLLGEEKGFRIFGPNQMLCRNERFRSFSLPASPMSRCDLLIFNRFEFETLGRTFEEIHREGVSAVVVTNGAEGGNFSLCNASTEGKPTLGAYKAVKPPAGAELFLVGAGDWFLGGLTSHLVNHVETSEKGTSLLSMPFDILQESCNFGARVASKKIVMKGGSNGPIFADLA